MSPTAAPIKPDLDAIQRDAEERVSTLREQRRRIAPEALIDANAKAELATVESELADAERALELTGLADEEIARREVESIERVKTKNIVSLQTQIADLDGKCHTLAVEVDRTLKLAARAVHAYVAGFEQRQALRTELREARGERGFYSEGPAANRIEDACVYHFGTTPRLLRLENTRQVPPRSLADYEPANDQPAEEAE